MNDYLTFAEVAGELSYTLNKVRTLVIENKTLRATRIAKNGLVLDSCGPEGYFPYDLDFCCHLDDNGEITSDVYGVDSTGHTVLLETLDVGALRVERADLENFRIEHPPRPAFGSALNAPESKEQRQNNHGSAQTASVIHTTREKKRDALTPVIELAQLRCRNPTDTAEVWGKLLALAADKEPPFFGVTAEGLQYLKASEETAYFTQHALKKRLDRAAASGAVKRR